MRSQSSFGHVLWGLAVVGVMQIATASAEDIGYLEDYSLAANREQALQQLIPGTDDYYYYHALYYQTTEQFGKVEDVLKAWIKRHGHTQRVHEIQHRQALLTYPQAPQKSLEYLRQKLNLHFNHQREELNQKPNLPTAFDQKLIARGTLKARAESSHRNTTDGFESTALDWLIQQKLTADRRRHLLGRLSRPDHENLVSLIAADLNYKHSGGFGSLAIHGQLLQTQMDELLKAKPDLKNQTNFVNAFIGKLHPHDDVNWRHTPEATEAYLDRLWDYVSTLAPVHNSLKAHVLYHRLAFDRAQGKYDKDRFLTYIKLPRDAGYVDQDYLRLNEHRNHRANLHQDFNGVTLLAPVGNDEPLVRGYLAHFFVKETAYKPYTTYINDLYLKHLFAEVKIVNGLGDVEQWASLLPPEQFQQLKDRIDLDFAPTNKTRYAADDAVSLDLDVKNVETLLVKIYEINTRSWYRAHHREVDTDINLDGLVPNSEQTHHYTEPPLRRVRRHFEFPTLNSRGVYVIDFIGNGRSSRALVRKGKLHSLVRGSIAGQVFTVLDEKNQHVKKASLWLRGHEYTADKDGRIAVPFSNQPGAQAIVLCDGGFCSLDHFQHEAESYQLHAAFHVDRESLIRRKIAKVIIRPSLTVNGTPAVFTQLKDVRLTITSTDHDGVNSSKEVGGDEIKLALDRDTVYEFAVPDRLASLHFTLQATIKNLSQGHDVSLSANQAVTLNQIDTTQKIEDLHLARFGGQYVIELLGKTGEPLGARPVRLVLKHRDFKDQVHATLQTDEMGRIAMGELAGITQLSATSPQGVGHNWNLLDDQYTHQQNRHGVAGDLLQVAYLGTADLPRRDEVSLLEIRGSTFVADRFDNLTIENGYLNLKGLPRGDYDLLLKSSGNRVHIRLTEGDVRDGYVLGPHRHLQKTGFGPMQLVDVTTDDKALKLKFAHAGKYARVHVIATRYRPQWPAYAVLSAISPVEPYRTQVPFQQSAYVEGRNIGDEYRYILERKYATKYPGNMLKRPSLLLNPWAIRDTSTSEQRPAAGEAFEGEGGGMGGQRFRAAPKVSPPAGRADFSNLDFLSQQSVVLTNLFIGRHGDLEIPRKDLGAHSFVQIVAVDHQNTLSRVISLPETDREFLDLRLANGMDPKRHFTQMKKINVIAAGETLTLADIGSARFETVDSLAKAYSLYATLSGNSDLAEFRFILDWPNLKLEQKREKYTKHACHELNFFLFKKDPQFFEAVVRPYILHKKDKTFLDHWLTGGDLSRYTDIWDYQRLNIAERILLSQKLQNDRAYTSRHVKDLYALEPPNVDRFNTLFATAVTRSSLDADEEDMERLGRLMEENKKLDMPAARLAAPMSKPGDGKSSRGRDRSEREPKGESAERDKRLSKKRKGKRDAEKKRPAMFDDMADEALDFEFSKADAKNRESLRQFFRKLDKTKEYVENNYWHLPIAQQNAGLINVSAFWADYAEHDPAKPFRSTHLADASRSFPEMIFALALLDLPFTAEQHDIEYADARMTLKAGSPLVAFHEEIEPTDKVAKDTPILVSQNFFREGDRYRHVNGEQVDKYVTDEFLVHTVYGCQVVVTNPTSSAKKLDVLLQIPVGAVPVNSRRTNSVHVALPPYHTQRLEYHFYFPLAGDFAHYPVHVAHREEIVAHAAPVSLHVVTEPSNIDKESWAYLSQHGTPEQVLDYLKQHNLHRLDLSRIAFRMQDADYFAQVVSLLSARHAYDHTLWSYGIHHNQVPAVQQYLQHADSFLAQCGESLESPLVRIDPVIRKTYEHKEYMPLVNARAHQLGRRRQILNSRFHEQYHRLLKILSYRTRLNDEDRLAITYYMLLQDRVTEAITLFEMVNRDNLPSQLQYDYCAAYVSFYRDNLDLAAEIAARYANHPVERWRNRFAAVTSQIDEIKRGGVETTDPEDRNQQQTKLAATESNFDFRVESGQVVVNYQNVKQVRVNYYLMDIELLFSRNPFVQAGTERFSFIKPNATKQVKLPAKNNRHAFALPKEFAGSNVLVEIVGGGHSRSQAHYANTLFVTTSENYGQLQVRNDKSRKPESRVYVKVYARLKDGRTKFFKDGYTDLRGRFDYVSLNTNELDNVDRFALLVLSEQHGAIVKEAAPPKR